MYVGAQRILLSSIQQPKAVGRCGSDGGCVGDDDDDVVRKLMLLLLMMMMMPIKGDSSPG